LFRENPANLPDPIKAEMQSIVEQLLVMMDKYTKAAENQEKEDEGEGDDEDDEDSDDYFGDGDLPKRKNRNLDDEDDSDPDDVYDDEYLFGDSDMNLYSGPFDKLHAPLYFKQVMVEIEGTNPEMYQSLLSLISADAQSKLNEIFSKCEEMTKE
jgi:hypothetical protein